MIGDLVMPCARDDGYWLFENGEQRFVPFSSPALQAFAKVVPFKPREKLRLVSRIGEHFDDRADRGEDDLL